MITFYKKLGSEKAGSYFDIIYHDLKRKAEIEKKSNYFPKISFFYFLLPFLSYPFKIILLFAEDILYTFKKFFDKLKDST